MMNYHAEATLKKRGLNRSVLANSSNPLIIMAVGLARSGSTDPRHVSQFESLLVSIARESRQSVDSVRTDIEELAGTSS